MCAYYHYDFAANTFFFCLLSTFGIHQKVIRLFQAVHFAFLLLVKKFYNKKNSNNAQLFQF